MKLIRILKIELLLLFIIPSYLPSQAQQMKAISAYDNQNSYTSGLYSVNDTAIYRYSWYYHEWFALGNQGLTRVNDTLRISSLAVYNNNPIIPVEFLCFRIQLYLTITG
jgi:hypothetical protein